MVEETRPRAAKLAEVPEEGDVGAEAETRGNGFDFEEEAAVEEEGSEPPPGEEPVVEFGKTDEAPASVCLNWMSISS